MTDRGSTVDPQRTDPEPTGRPTDPACPHCGSGPLVPTPIGTVCKSCARTVGALPDLVVTLEPDVPERAWCTDCRAPLTPSHEEQTSRLCLRCLNGDPT